MPAPSLVHLTGRAASDHKASHPKHVLRPFLDFDGTITEKDTLHLVADAGYGAQARGNVSSCLPPWQEIVDAYLLDFKKLAETYRPIKSQRSSISQEIEWLHSLQPIEEASAERAAEAGIFNHVKRSDIAHAAREALRSGKVKVREGYDEFMSYICTRNCRIPNIPPHSIPVTILSVNWSTSFIYTVATEVCILTTDDTNTHTLPAWTENLQIFANELPSITRTSPAQQMHHVIRTSGDKTRHFNTLCSNSSDPNERTLYIGDSITDLECLLAAHTGICMRDEHMGSSQQELGDTCQRLGIEIKHIHHKQDLDKSPGLCLWWANNFTEIQCWLQLIDSD